MKIITFFLFFLSSLCWGYNAQQLNHESTQATKKIVRDVKVQQQLFSRKLKMQMEINKLRTEQGATIQPSLREYYAKKINKLERKMRNLANYLTDVD